MLKDFRMGNPHALDYCLPVNPPKALYTPPRERRSAIQQALAAAGDAFTTGRSRMDWSVKSLPSGDFEVVQAAAEPRADRQPGGWQVGKPTTDGVYYCEQPERMRVWANNEWHWLGGGRDCYQDWSPWMLREAAHEGAAL